MKLLWSTIFWDLRLQVRYNILTIAILITALYVVIFLNMPVENYDKLLILLIFTDPTIFGFIFIGGLIMFEKGAGTLKAIVVTPLQPWQYIWSKALSLTMIAVPASLIMSFAGHGPDFHYLWLIMAVVYASLLFVLIGFIGVTVAKTLNQYLVLMPFSLMPFVLPMLNFFEITDTWLLYLIPSQACILLFEGAFGEISTINLIYSILYPLPFIWLFYLWAKRVYVKYVVK